MAQLSSSLYLYCIFIFFNDNDYQKNASKVPGKSVEAKKKKHMNCYLVFLDEKKESVRRDNPGFSANEVTKELNRLWKATNESEKEEYREKANTLNSESNLKTCPKCPETFANEDDLISHLLERHVSNKESSSGASTSSNQSTIEKCNVCGRMFCSVAKLNEHQLMEHMDSNVIPEQNQEVEEISQVELLEEAETRTLVWVRLANQNWPAKVVRYIGELTEIEFFDDENSTKTVENTKIKPFEKLTKVPKRSNLWKAAYNKALKMLN